MRVVIDTGVIISASLVPEGTSYKAFIYALTHGVPLISVDTLEELHHVFNKKKFAGKILESHKTVVKNALQQRADFILISSNFTICRDPNDDIFLNLAIDGKADVILSRDPDLLELHPFQGIPILNPADFLSWAEINGNN